MYRVKQMYKYYAQRGPFYIYIYALPVRKPHDFHRT